jgi:hypothetical protein
MFSESCIYRTEVHLPSLTRILHLPVYIKTAWLNSECFIFSVEKMGRSWKCNSILEEVFVFLFTSLNMNVFAAADVQNSYGCKSKLY